MSNNAPQKPIVEFPCDYPIKIFGLNNAEYVETVTGILSEHDKQFSAEHLDKRPSKDGRYLALSTTLKAKDQAMMNSIYQALTASPHVIMSL